MLSKRTVAWIQVIAIALTGGVLIGAAHGVLAPDLPSWVLSGVCGTLMAFVAERILGPVRRKERGSR